MPIKHEKDDGEEIEVYTAEEKAAEIAKIEADYQAKLAEKDEFMKKKTEEFVLGKKSVEHKETEKEKEWNEKFEATKKLAEEAVAKAELEKNARLIAVRDFVFNQYGANDAETKKKLSDAWDLVNMPMDNEEQIKERARVAASIAGVGSVQVNSPVMGAPFSGGYAPTFKREEGLKEEDHDRFKHELGLGNIIPKKQ